MICTCSTTSVWPLWIYLITSDLLLDLMFSPQMQSILVAPKEKLDMIISTTSSSTTIIHTLVRYS